MPIVAFLTGKIAGPLFVVISAALAFSLIIAVTLNSVHVREITRLTATIGQLKGSLAFQNQMVSQLGAQSAAAQAKARSLTAASRQAHAGDAAVAAALVAKPVETDPVLACKAADDTIQGFANRLVDEHFAGDGEL